MASSMAWRSITERGPHEARNEEWCMSKKPWSIDCSGLPRELRDRHRGRLMQSRRVFGKRQLAVGESRRQALIHDNSTFMEKNMSPLKKNCLLTLLILSCNIPPFATAQEEGIDDADLLLSIVPAAIIPGNILRRFNACMGEMRPGCENTYNYCMMTVQEKISYQLQLCLDQKFECYSACEQNYEQCCTESGLPECPHACQIQKDVCMAACDAEGDQCVQNAIGGNYDPPIEDECQNDLEECLENAKELCREESLSPNKSGTANPHE